MKLNTLLEYLLTEEKRPAKAPPEEAPEAPEDSPLGQYLFAPARNDVPVPKEPNTDLEQTLMKDLHSHFEGSGDVSKIDASLETLLGFEKQGLYPKLLKPPSGLAYRFLSNVSIETASSLYLKGLSVETIIETPNKAFCVEPLGVIENPAYKSTVGRGFTKAASWTIAPTTYNFGDFTSTKSGYVAIVLVADIDSNKNFLLNPNNIASFAQDDHRQFDASLIKNEKEVISLGPVNVLKAAYMFIQSPVSQQEKSSLIRNVPAIDWYTAEDNEIYKKEAFKKQFEYIEGCLSDYKKKLTRTQLKVITSAFGYKLLKLAATKGIDANSLEDLETVSNLLYPNYPFTNFKKSDTLLARLRGKIYHYLSDASTEFFARLFDQINKQDKFSYGNSVAKAGGNTQAELLRALNMKTEFKIKR